MEGMIFKFLNIFLICVVIIVVLQNVNSSRIDADSYFDSNIALKRRQTSGLIPFPRVGRSNFRFLEQMKRREGLIPFPRVGKRSEDKMNDIAVSWFGPRLGRSFYRSNLDLEEQYILSLLRDYQLAEVNKDNKSSNNRSNHDEYVFQDEVKNKNIIQYPPSY